MDLPFYPHPAGAGVVFGHGGRGQRVRQRGPAERGPAPAARRGAGGVQTQAGGLSGGTAETGAAGAETASQSKKMSLIVHFKFSWAWIPF